MFTKIRRFVLTPEVLVPLIALIVVSAWFALRSTGGTASAATERTVTATTGTLAQTVSVSGTLQPADTENLSFSAPGKVTAVNVAAGQTVTKGAVLATIDSASLQSQVAQAQAGVDSASARLASDTAGGGSTAQTDADQAGLTAADAQLASAQASLAGATLVSPIDGTVATVDLTVGQQLGSGGSSATALSGTGTGSGQSGQVTGATGAGSDGGNGSSASGGSGTGGSGGGSGSTSSTPQVKVISTGSFVVDLAVDDTAIGQISVGRQAVISPSTASGAGSTRGGGNRAAGGGAIAATAPSGGSGNPPGGASTPGQTGAGSGGATTASATGTVTSVGMIASFSSGVASFPVVVTVDGTPAGFHAGAATQVTITYNELTDVTQVPAGAVSRANGQSYVTVVEGSTRTKRPIQTGASGGGQVQVTDGLTAGDEVAITIPAATGSTGSQSRTNGGNGGGGGFGGGSVVRGGGG